MKSTVHQITTSPQFKSMTLRAVFSILVFITTYLLLIAASIGCIILLGYAGLYLIAFKPSFYTLIIGVGLISIGLLIFIFLIKFLFSKNKVDNSGLIELKREDAPELYIMIEEIVSEAKTHFPKKIYLSPEVNACVFYNSGFWSMFLPVKKNLQIGMALVNSVTVTEFKAILAHEFGHFSQKTMKVGSYVYNVNKILYDMLYQNEGYNKLAGKWASVNQYLNFFVGVAISIVNQLQLLLKWVYSYVNKSYMALSREMEFHADEVAAHIAGSQSLISSLLRLDIANNAYNAVLNHYDQKITSNERPDNIYPSHLFTLNFLGQRNKVEIRNNLPVIEVNQLGLYNKSKLVVTNQWASHPSTEDRVAALQKLNIPVTTVNNNMATVLFKNHIATEIEVTNKLFSAVQFEAVPTSTGVQDFQKDFTSFYDSNTFNLLYNGYYSNRNPIVDSLEKSIASCKNTAVSFKDLFSQEKIEIIYVNTALQEDAAFIKQLTTSETEINSVDYDGVKYSKKDFETLLLLVEKQLEESNDAIKKMDEEILCFFYNRAVATNKLEIWKSYYNDFLQFDKDYDIKQSKYNSLMEEAQFIQYTNTIEVINTNLALVKQKEEPIKAEIRNLLDNNHLNKFIKPEDKKNLEAYIEKNYEYFLINEYINDNLSIFYKGANAYMKATNDIYFNLKKQLLDFQVSIID